MKMNLNNPGSRQKTLLEEKLKQISGYKSMESKQVKGKTLAEGEAESKKPEQKNPETIEKPKGKKTKGKWEFMHIRPIYRLEDIIAEKKKRSKSKAGNI